MAFRRLGDWFARYVGIGGATGDASNPLSVRGSGSLFDGDTGDHQLRINKAATGDTASHVFQTGFSGRAEFGLIGNDDFELRVSPDGSNFTQALVVDNGTGDADFKQALRRDGADVLTNTGPQIIQANDDEANAGFNGVTLDINASGSDALTADRNHKGLWVDLDSTATGGDTSDEHRVYGAHIDVSVTGDSDLVCGTYNFAAARHSSGTVSTLRGAFNVAQVDMTGGVVTTTYGAHNVAVVDAVGGSIGNCYGSWNQVTFTPNFADNANSAIGVRGEIQTDFANTLSIAYAVQAVIDHNAGTISTGYLFHGDYQGSLPSTAWGIYIADAVPNYFAGDIQVLGDYAVGAGLAHTFKIDGNTKAQVNEHGLGVNGATADATNAFSFYGTNLLLNSGGSIDLKYNKNAAGNDASMTFQTGFSSKAIIGLLANDDFTIKVGSSSTTAVVIDEDTGVVTMPATPVSKFFAAQSGRVYCLDDARWVTPYDDGYGPANHNNSESGGAGTNPILEWEHMGEYVRAGTVVHELSMYGRITDAATIADMEIYVVFVYPAFPDRWDGDASTGIDADAEMLSTLLWRGFWKAGTATTGTALSAYAGPVTDQIRRKFEFTGGDFICPVDGQLRVYFKPLNVDPRPNTSNDYMYQTHSWLLSYS